MLFGIERDLDVGSDNFKEKFSNLYNEPINSYMP